MRGRVDRQQSIFVAFDLEQRVPDDHPLRTITQWADAVLSSMSRDFTQAYGTTPHTPIDARMIKADSEASHAQRRARRRMKTVGYRLSQRVRKPCEQIIGWGKTVAGLARTRVVGLVRIENAALLAGAAYNLLRMTRLSTG